MSPHLREGGHIVFGVDPVDIGVRVSVGIGLTLLCIISYEPVHVVFTKFSLTYNLDITKN